MEITGLGKCYTLSAILHTHFIYAVIV